MPSLMPGIPGTKEAYGIAIIRDDFSIAIPPKAIKRYELLDGDFVLLSTTHRGEGGLAILNKTKAEKSVFGKYINLINKTNTIFWFNDESPNNLSRYLPPHYMGCITVKWKTVKDTSFKAALNLH